MKLSHYDLASYNEATQAWETAPGKYIIGFGASVEDIRATATYSLSKQKSVKCHDVMKGGIFFSHVTYRLVNGTVMRMNYVNFKFVYNLRKPVRLT